MSNSGRRMRLIRQTVSALYGLGLLALASLVMRYNRQIGELLENAPLWMPIVACGLLVLFVAAVDRGYLLVRIISVLNLGIFSFLLMIIVMLDLSMFSEFRMWGLVPIWAIPLVVLIVVGRVRDRPE